MSEILSFERDSKCDFVCVLKKTLAIFGKPKLQLRLVNDSYFVE